MKALGRKVVVEYRYDSEEEAKRHEVGMMRDGWQIEASTHLFIPHYRSFSQRQLEGAFL